MLTDPAIQSVLLFRPGNIWQGRTVIQMGTITPTESRAISDEIVAAGGDHLKHQFWVVSRKQRRAN